jgi:hypothetical protein
MGCANADIDIKQKTMPTQPTIRTRSSITGLL